MSNKNKTRDATISQPVTIIRDVRRVIAPVGIRCVLCKLQAGNSSDGGVDQIDVKYNGNGIYPENPIVALNRRKYICNDCVDAIKESAS